MSLSFRYFRFVSTILSWSVLCNLPSPLDGADEKAGVPVPSNEASKAEALRRWHEAKFGLFLHWGAYSVYGGTYQGKELWSAEWIQENARISYAEYARTAAAWNPADFNADEWVRLAKSAGMGYIVITARHHDGFAIYPSKASSYNLMASGAYKGPDPLAALKAACKRHGLLFGVYYSVLEFRGSPRGFDAEDAKAIAAGFDYRTLGPEPHATPAQIAALAKAQIKEIVDGYQPDILWFDGSGAKMGEWSAADGREVETYIRNALPDVMINNRLGVDGSDFRSFENKMPGTPPAITWEYCWNMGAFWGYNPRNYQAKILKTPEHYIETLVQVASLGGNYLLNVGPDSTGKFHPMAVDYLTKIGKWTRANSEAVHGVSQSPFKEKPDWGYVTAREGKVYLIISQWPAEGAPLRFPALKNKCLGANWLAAPGKPLKVVPEGSQWSIDVGARPPDSDFRVIVLSVEGVPVAAR